MNNHITQPQPNLSVPRMLTARAVKRYFGNKGEFYAMPLLGGNPAADGLQSTHFAIRSWLKALHSLEKGTQEYRLAHRELAALYFKQGVLCRRHYEENRGDPAQLGFSIERSLAKFQRSFSHLKKASQPEGESGWNGVAMVERRFALHEELSWGYSYLAEFAACGSISGLGFRLAEWGASNGKLGKIAKKASYHREQSSDMGDRLSYLKKYRGNDGIEPKAFLSTVESGGACGEAIAPEKPIEAARRKSEDFKSNFSRCSGVYTPNATSLGEAKIALLVCAEAVSSWASVDKTAEEESAGHLEAQLALADIYSLKGGLELHIYQRLIRSSGPDALHWAVQAGEAFKNAVACLEKAELCILDAAERLSVKHRKKDALQNVHFSYHYAAVLSAGENPLCLPLPSVDELGGRNDQAGAYAIVAIVNRQKAEKLHRETLGLAD